MRKQELHPRTATINNKQKHISKMAKLDALKWLSDKFPEAFDNTESIRPLKQGIMEDILKYADEALASGISKSKLREAVVIFTRRVDYLTCLKAREVRIDLFGNPTVLVSEEEAQKAASKLRKRVEKSIRNAKKAQSPKEVATTKSSSDIYRDTKEQYSQGYYSDTEKTAGYYQKPENNKSPDVVIKNKSKNLDPTAVARLKEKLGISQKAELVD